MKFAKYLTIWRMMAELALQETFVNRYSNVLFFIGKVLRLAMSLIFLLLIKNNVSQFAQYTTDQMLVFFLTYQFVDVFAQVLFRGVYIFSRTIRQGDLDFFLSKPINPLFMSLMGKPDINDAIFFIPSTAISLYIFSTLNLSITLASVFWFLALLFNSILIALSLHILILAAGVILVDVDGVVWLYRDLLRLARFPVSVYREPLRFLLFFLVPVGVMISVPASVLLKTSPTHTAITSSIFGISFFFISLKIWKRALREYGSASS